jgi:redox-sensitive bicupin YhaK (pirin superfamily)
MTGEKKVILQVEPLGFPWKTQDPFIFCVYHADAYPEGNGKYGPKASLDGRNIGNDFVIREGWRMYHGNEVPGFPVHPHRGFETVTVVRKGIVDHSDSFGGAGRYGHGDVQWMTAGKGIQHAEMFPLLSEDKPNPLELFQIWLNLPMRSKMVEPHYKMLWDEQIAKLELADDQGRRIDVEIVSGSLDGRDSPKPPPDSWAADDSHEVKIWYISMEEHASWNIPLASEGVNRTLYFFEGSSVEINGQSVPAGNLIELESLKDVYLKNSSRAGRFLMLQGKPIEETVVSYGPFVMNSKLEIQQAYQDFQETRFGGWPWERHDPVHGRKERFARYSDGNEESPPVK